MSSCTDSCDVEFFSCFNSCVASNCSSLVDDDLVSECNGSCYDSCTPSYNSCLNNCNTTPSTPSTPSNTSFNVVESVDGANVVLNDDVVATEIGQPMFFWYGQLLNVAITFVPVIVVVSCFWLIYGYLKGLGNKNSLDSKKSLDNK